ncbi:MAG TPA: DUF5937 family protein [Longimicrobiales bacterium]
MIEFRLEPEDLVQVRFAFSPLWEVVMSVRALVDPGRHALHLPWALETRRVLRGLELAPLIALVNPPDGYCPDFLAPPPETPMPEFEAELARLRRTPPELVRREVGRLAAGRATPSPVLERLLEDTEPALADLADLIAAYWERALAPHWPRLRVVLESDVLHRARRLALEGAEGLYADLHPSVRYRPGVLEVDKRCVRHRAGGGGGLLMIPSVFSWPDVFVVPDEPWRPSIMYPARGAGTLWLDAPPARGAALELLLGRGRARVMRELSAPTTTGEVARRLGFTTSAASQHLTALARAGVIERTRVGRRVYYTLSARGRSLVELLDGGPTPNGSAPARQE